jgi:GDP/UDP-N,N'-diacetylbacillosamine 2-epimerase (hydrolysing)
MQKRETTKQNKRRVMVITGTRADYGILLPVIQAIDKHPKLELQLLATGMHLLRKFGHTIDEVEQDGWPIAGRVRLQGSRDDIIGNSRAFGTAIARMADIFHHTKTDIVLVLGDRMEMFAAAAAATASQLTLAHIHGGDTAIGVQDEAYRHAISKLAHIHFAASAGAQKRLLMLGEESFRIYQTGSPALDNLSKKICKKITVLNSRAGFDVMEDFLLVLQHPAGGSASQEEKRMAQTLSGCDRKGLKLLVLCPNCDSGFSGIIRAAQRFCRAKSHPFIKHLPRDVFLGLLTHARVLIGNSSSGIIETGYLNVDVIDVGPRQTGRDRGANVIDIDYGRKNVSGAVDKILQRRGKNRRKPCTIYGDGRSGIRIAAILAKTRIDQKLKQKKITY